MAKEEKIAPNIRQYLAENSRRIQRMDRKPIILKWLDSPTMVDSLPIMDRRVAELMQRRNDGGSKKLRQWFFSDDQDFIAITAERYIIHYLQQHNPALVDPLAETGVDAVLQLDGESIGVEITSLNGYIAEWIFIERLTEYIRANDRLRRRGLEVTYSYQRIRDEETDHTIYDYVEAVGSAMACDDGDNLALLDVSVEPINRFPGSVSWHHEKADTYPWFDMVTDRLADKLGATSKQKQLAQYDRNLVFVGVNNVAPANGIVPYVFEALAVPSISYGGLADEIRAYWSDALKEFDNLDGICFFVYYLNQEAPFYPLAMIWRGGAPEFQLYLWKHC